MVELGDSSGSRYRGLPALEDTSTSHTTIPTSFLRELRVTPHTRRGFVLADSRQVGLWLGRT